MPDNSPPTATTASTVSAERRIDALLAHYGQSHQNPRNAAIHYGAIPLIMLSLCGLIFAVHPWLAYAFIAASMVYYARLSWVFFGIMCVWSVLVIIALHAMGGHVLWASVLIFIGAWVAQFIGHKIEGKKPSFFEDLQYLWIGPLFVLSKPMRRLGIHW